jgi:hypothetical protein
MFQNPLVKQKIVDYKLWEVVIDKKPKRSIAKDHTQIIAWAKKAIRAIALRLH